MELTDLLRAIRKSWWITVLMLVVTVGAAVLLTMRATPVYQSSVTFFVAASSDTGTALQADEFAQRRINSYVGVLRSDRLADTITGQPGVNLSAQQVKARISASADPDTVLLTATVQDTNADRALAIAEQIAEHFGPLVSELDNTRSASSASVSLTVISGPTLLPDPVSPRGTLNIGVAILAGLALGVTLSIVRQMRDRSVRTPEDLKQASGLATLASITVESRSRRSSEGGLLIVGSEPGSPRAESFRQLRTNLTFSAVTNKMQVVVVTSAIAGDGKTTTATNLAIALAESGRSVLLIEADMRRPKVADYLGIEGGAGLTNVLAGQAEIDDVMQAWGAHGLHVLAAGTLPPNPSELLGSTAMRDLMLRLRDRFELIVLDTPPVLPLTDASVVAVHADSVVLVVRYAGTTREQVHTAVQSLAAVGAPLAGGILNGIPVKAGEDSYRYTSFGTTEPRRSRRVWPLRRRRAGRRELPRRADESRSARPVTIEAPDAPAPSWPPVIRHPEPLEAPEPLEPTPPTDRIELIEPTEGEPAAVAEEADARPVLEPSSDPDPRGESTGGERDPRTGDIIAVER